MGQPRLFQPSAEKESLGGQCVGGGVREGGDTQGHAISWENRDSEIVRMRMQFSDHGINPVPSNQEVDQSSQKIINK